MILLKTSLAANGNGNYGYTEADLLEHWTALDEQVTHDINSYRL